MNILYVYYSDYDSTMAHGGQIIHTANGLEDLGHSVRNVTIGDIDSYARENRVDIRFDVDAVPFSVGNTYIDHLIYYLVVLRHALWCDVVFTRDIWFLKFLAYLPRCFRPPVVYEGHQCYSGIDYLSPEEEYARLTRADLIITQSHGVADDLRSLGIDVADVIPNAANVDLIPDVPRSELREQMGIADEETVVVYSGSLNEWKNDIEMLVKTVKNLNSKIYLLLIGGENDRVAELEEMASNGCPSHIRTKFTGRVPHREVFKYLKAADIGVVPLKTGHEEAERYTSPIKLFEYLVSDLQVVASDVPAIRREFGDVDSVHLYEPGDSHALLESLERADQAETPPETTFSYRRRAEKIEEQLERLCTDEV